MLNNNQQINKTLDQIKLNNMPWVEKQRPKTISEIAFQDEVVSAFHHIVNTNEFPHLLFQGPPGTGKTSSILALCNEIYGPDFRKDQRVLELNASDDRGINIIRTKIKDFAHMSPKSGIHPLTRRELPLFKIIILDEADNMTSDAQSALRRIIEAYTNTTRFVLICNYVSKLLDALASRCVRFRFKPITEQAQKEKLLQISKQESITIDGTSLDTLLKVSDGDLRKTITLLQSASSLYDKVLTNEGILSVSGNIPDQVVEEMINCMLRFDDELLIRQCKECQYQGYPVDQLLRQMYEKIIMNNTYGETRKCAVIEKIAEGERKLIEGADEYLQLLNIALGIAKDFQVHK